MPEIKDTARATVHIGFDGKVHKHYRGARARERFDTEVAVLRYLEQRECSFVPKLLEADSENLRIVTTNCGTRVDYLSSTKLKAVFAEFEAYGVRHEDPFVRNVTYRASDGRFCLIDFEFATLLDDPSISLKPEADPKEPPPDHA